MVRGGVAQWKSASEFVFWCEFLFSTAIYILITVVDEQRVVLGSIPSSPKHMSLGSMDFGPSSPGYFFSASSAQCEYCVSTHCDQITPCFSLVHSAKDFSMLHRPSSKRHMQIEHQYLPFHALVTRGGGQLHHSYPMTRKAQNSAGTVSHRFNFTTISKVAPFPGATTQR